MTIDLSWFGQSGPYRDFKATDAMVRALTGFVQLIGPAEGSPLTLPDYQPRSWVGSRLSFRRWRHCSRPRGGAGK